MSDRAYNDSDLMGDEEPLDPPAAPAPMLQMYREAFDGPGIAPEARDLAYDQTTLVNDYQQRRRIADENAAAGQEFVAGLDGFKSGMVSMVQSDPLALDLGFNLAALTIDGMVSALPNVPDGITHRDELIRHTQSEIAAAAITAAAEQDEGMARSLLGLPRVTELLGEAAGPLDTYITLQAQARVADRQAEAELLQRRASERVDRSAINYLGALHDPRTDEVTFPPGWNQAILADDLLPPAAKVAVAGIYNRLRTEGDASASDPFLVSHLASRIAGNDPPPVADVAQMMGRGLTVADAMLLLGGAGPASVQSRREFGALASTLDLARDALAPPENGPAGQAAFARFTNWLMPEYRRNGPGSLNAASDNFLLAGNPIQAFAPRPSDFADAAIARDDRINIEPLGAMAREITGSANRSRKTIAQIFSGEERIPNEPRLPRGYERGEDGGVQPIQPPMNPNRAPFYGVERPNPSQRIGGGAQNIVAGDPEPIEVLTDTGIKRLTAADLRQSTSGPRPQPRRQLTEEEQAAILNGRPVNLPPEGRRGRVLPANPRRRR